MIDRRGFLTGAALPAAGLLFDPSKIASALSVLTAPDDRSPDVVATDEAFWRPVQDAFPVDRSFVNLNNGGVCPAPAIVLDAMARHVAFSNHAPSYTMWRVLQPRRKHVRRALADHWGVSVDEIAITRNASEALQTLQFGFDLAPGDEVVTTTQDYPRMINAFRQREQRQGIVLKQFDIPVPAEDDDEIVRLFEEQITERTKLILMCHMINLTGQVLPVAKVVAMARRHGVPVIIDGAHAFAHMPFTLRELDCDYYATSLHKWLNAPIGTGMLYVRKELIADVWPLMAAPDAHADDITKFEQVGTYPEANGLAVAEALTFHQAIGDQRKYARLLALRDRWALPLRAHDRVRLHTSLKPGFAGGIANIQIEGIDSGKLQSWLWRERGLWTTSIRHAQFEGLRVSAGVYTTLDEVDRFVEAMEHAAEHGIA